MSVLVKGMEMPDSCYHCKIAESCGHYIANYTDRRHPDCPLIALPDKHGRLVDADALAEEWRGSFYEGTVESLLNTAPTIEPEPHWIPCSEKLPEANGRYLVTRGLVAAGALWNRIYIANYSNLMGIKSVKIWWQGNVGKSDFERLDDVLAWMPLPECYREGD